MAGRLFEPDLQKEYRAISLKIAAYQLGRPDVAVARKVEPVGTCTLLHGLRRAGFIDAAALGGNRAAGSTCQAAGIMIQSP